jgi:hypothetical protein
MCQGDVEGGGLVTALKSDVSDISYHGRTCPAWRLSNGSVVRLLCPINTILIGHVQPDRWFCTEKIGKNLALCLVICYLYIFTFHKHSCPNYSTLYISHVCFQFGVQDHLAFKLTHRTHMTSDFDVPNMHGKLRR